MNAAYASIVLPQVPRLLGMLDRERDSATFGSFDREHWGWKFRDFPLTMLQIAAYPLAQLWRYPMEGNIYHRNARLREWIEGALRETCRRQHRNGAFDSVGPWTQDYGVTLAMVYGLTETSALLGEEVPAEVRDTVARACQFAGRCSEDYAFITNHQALFALAYRNAAELLDNPAYLRRAEAIIEEIQKQQSPEGWYREYGGPDPGYESLGIFYMAQYWRRTQSAELLKSLERAVDFYSWFVHPDGSVGGVYGSRHTALYYPAGFEILAQELPAAAAVARFLRERLALGNVVTPATCDAGNLPSLAYVYLEASRTAASGVAASQLPCESWRGVRRFERSGMVAAASDAYYAVANLRKGGVCRVFDKRTAKVSYEDAGYLVRTAKRLFSSQSIGMSAPVSASESEAACEGALDEVQQTVLTPAKFLVLRLLNLTLFRSLALGAWLRRRILKRLILGRRPGPVRLKRSIAFGENEVAFHDCLTFTGRARVESITLARSFTSIHMGSARYFHSSELEKIEAPPLDGMVSRLNQTGEAAADFTLRFPVPGQDRAINMEVSSRS